MSIHDFGCGNRRKRDYMEDPGQDRRIILRRKIRKWDGGHGLDWSGSGHGQVVSTYKCGNELLGFIKCR
jgi:hypothetical protein